MLRQSPQRVALRAVLTKVRQIRQGCFVNFKLSNEVSGRLSLL